MRAFRRFWRALRRLRGPLQARLRHTATRITEGQIAPLDDDIVIQLRYFQG